MGQTAALTATALTDSIPLPSFALPCQEQNSELWFADTPAGLELAKSYCAPCPIRAECLAGAVERREPWGVWGGEIFEAGRVVARKRPRGRPRKDDAMPVAS